MPCFAAAGGVVWSRGSAAGVAWGRGDTESQRGLAMVKEIEKFMGLTFYSVRPKMC